MPEVDRSRQTFLVRPLVILVLLLAAYLRLANLPDVPFGWHPDEATKALLARDVLVGKYFPAFFSAFTGREALYVYLQAALFALAGEQIFVTRLLSAFCGILTVALTYATGSRLFNRRTGLMAAIFLATLLWHLIASRNGYRAVIQPLVQVPALLLMLQGMKTEGHRSLLSFVWAGLWLGLTQYTYTAARIFPLFILLIAGWLTLRTPGRVWARRRGFMAMGLAAALICAPLALHFLQNPVDFFGRAAQVSVFSDAWSGGEPLARLWQSVKETARMFTMWGDINYRFNIAGRPVFGAVDGALFYAGLVLVLWRVLRCRGMAQTAAVITILWIVVLVVPMTLSAESLPYYQRAIGILPAIAFLPALVVDAALDWLGQRKGLESALRRALPAAAALSLAVWLGARAHGHYFDDWHMSERNDDDRRVAMVYVADYLSERPASGRLYLSTQYVQHPTLALLAPRQYDQVRWFDARQSLPLPQPSSQATYVLLRENPAQKRLLEALPGLSSEFTAMDRFGRPVFDVITYQATEWPTANETSTAYWSWEVTFNDAAHRNAIALPVNFGNVLSFAGHNRHPQEAQPGQLLELTLFWEILERPERHYTFFAHVLDENSQVIAGYDANTYPSPFWDEQGGELLLSYFPMQLPGGLAEGNYQLEIGVYHQPSGERLFVLQDGEIVADRLLLKPLVIRAGR